MPAHRKPVVRRSVNYNAEKYEVVAANPRWVGSFWQKVERTPECWEWTAALSGGGYGFFRNCYAHRLAYHLLVEPVPADQTVDHLCRNRRCVRPEHLEVVTIRENTLRSGGVTALNAQKTHCPAGHPYDEENTYWIRGGQRAGKRQCRTCAAASRVRTAEKKAEYDRQRRATARKRAA